MTQIHPVAENNEDSFAADYEITISVESTALTDPPK